MDNWIVQLSAGGIFAVLIIREFVNLMIKLKGKNGNGNGSTPGTETVKDIKAITIDTNDKVKSLHEQHSKTDGDGLPMVYSPRSIVKNQERIAKSSEQTAMHMSRLAETQEKMADTLREIQSHQT